MIKEMGVGILGLVINYCFAIIGFWVLTFMGKFRMFCRYIFGISNTFGYIQNLVPYHNWVYQFRRAIWMIKENEGGIFRTW